MHVCRVNILSVDTCTFPCSPPTSTSLTLGYQPCSLAIAMAAGVRNGWLNTRGLLLWAWFSSAYWWLEKKRSVLDKGGQKTCRVGPVLLGRVRLLEPNHFFTPYPADHSLQFGLSHGGWGNMMDLWSFVRNQTSW